MGYFDSSEQPTKSGTSNGSNHGLGEAVGAAWFKTNVIDSAYKALVADPASAVIEGLNTIPRAVTGEDLIKQDHRLSTSQSDLWSKEWWAQSIAYGLASAITYATIGKGTGFLFRRAAAEMKLTGALGALVSSERTAQIAGATVYDGFRETKGNETHKGNAAAGFVGFSLYELSNSANRGLPLPARLLMQASFGSVTAMTQLLVSRKMSGQIVPDWGSRDWKDAALSGAAFNVIFPSLQSGFGKAIDHVNQTSGRGAPLERVINSNDWSGQSYMLDDLALSSPLARVVYTNDQHNSVDFTNQMMYLQKGSSAGDLAHALKLMENYERNNAKHQLKKAADCYRQLKPADAWEAYKTSRYDDEVSALLTQHLVNNHLQSPASRSTQFYNMLEDHEVAMAKAMEQLDRSNDFYESIWKQDYDKFVKTRYTYRPPVAYIKGDNESVSH